MTDDLYRPRFLPDLLIAALERNGERPCLYMDDEVITAAEMTNRISQYVQAFRSVGIAPGHGVATLSKNRPEVLCSMGAVMVAGARNTPLHPLGSLQDHAYVLQDAGIDTLIFDPAFAARAQQLQESVPHLQRLLSYGPTGFSHDLVETASTFEPERLVGPQVQPEDLSALAYTGGTTGKPKGVMNTYRGSATMAQIMVSEWQWPDEVRHLICTPLSHAGSSLFVPLLMRGGSMVVLPGFDATAVLNAIERHRITTIMLVPSMIYALLDHQRFAETDLSSLRTIFYGASPMSPARLQEGIRKLGPVFFQFYGQTECPQTVCILRKEEHVAQDLARLASCGRPVPWMNVALLDDEGEEVPRGTPGELCVRGPMVMKGYWGKPDETARALDGGWLHTGDVAVQDLQGYLTIVDRKKDMIVSGGFNIFPREVEDVISTHPAVAAVAVVGVPDKKWGEAVKAVVVRRDGSVLDVEELIMLVKEHKGSHYAPKSVDIVESIPDEPPGQARQEGVAGPLLGWLRPAGPLTAVDLVGKSALVTGAAGGLGSATAFHLAGLGMLVVLFDRDAAEAAAVASRIGDSALAVGGDVTVDDDVAAAVEAARKRGPLSVLVNIAGGGVPSQRLVARDGTPHDRQAFEYTMAINALGTFNVSRLAAAVMVTNEPDTDGQRGVIVNTSSLAGLEGQAGQVAYAAAKAAIVGMTLPLARDLAPAGIRVCTIAPGTMGTPTFMRAPEELKQRLVADVQFPKRMGRPEEFALLVEMIACHPYLNGETIRLDAALRFPPK